MTAESKIIFFLDFDGTLSPIVKDPKDAVLPPDMKRRLKAASEKKNVKIAIVTGRAMADIKRRVGLKGIIYSANHGMEIYYNGRYLLKKGDVYRAPLRKLARELSAGLAQISGAIVESKGLSVAVHFRKAKKSSHSRIKMMVKKISGPYTKAKRHALQLTGGKMIMEVRPAKFWNKGDAVMWMWKELAPRHIPVYVGDDVTDEDAFKAIRPYGLTIRIGKKKNTHAEYFMRTPSL